LLPSLPKKTDPAKMPPHACESTRPGLFRWFDNRPILASRAKYFNKNMIMANGEGLTAKGRERTNVKDFHLLPFAFCHSPFTFPIDSTIRSISMSN